MDEDKAIDWLKDDIQEIKGTLKTMSDNFNTFMVETCSSKHKELENKFDQLNGRLTKLEVRVYGVTALIVFIVGIAVKFWG